MQILLSQIETFDAPVESGKRKSLQRFGQIMPVILAPGDDGHYRVLAGRRRIAALRSLGATHVEAIVRDNLDEQGQAAITVLENLQRSPNPVVEARALVTLLDGRDQKAVADLLGISKAKICQRLKILELPTALLAKVERGEMSARAAYRATRLPTETQEDLAAQEGKVTLKAVEEALDAHRVAALDLDAIKTPGPEIVLAAQLRRVAEDVDGPDRVVLLDAALILESLA